MLLAKSLLYLLYQQTIMFQYGMQVSDKKI